MLLEHAQPADPWSSQRAINAHQPTTNLFQTRHLTWEKIPTLDSQLNKVDKKRLLILNNDLSSMSKYLQFLSLQTNNINHSGIKIPSFCFLLRILAPCYCWISSTTIGGETHDVPHEIRITFQRSLLTGYEAQILLDESCVYIVSVSVTNTPSTPSDTCRRSIHNIIILFAKFWNIRYFKTCIQTCMELRLWHFLRSGGVNC